MRTVNASLFLFAAFAFTHAVALPTHYRRQGGSSSASASIPSSSATASLDFLCPTTDNDGASLSNNTVDGDILTCSYGSLVCSYALENGNQVIEQDSSVNQTASPSNCPLNAVPASASATATASASASSSTAPPPDFKCPPTDNDGVSLSNSTLDSSGLDLTCSYDTSLGPRTCLYSEEDGGGLAENGSSIPSSCLPLADTVNGSSSASATSTASTSASSSTAPPPDFKCPPTDNDGVTLSNSTLDSSGLDLTCSYDTSMGPWTCVYSEEAHVFPQDGGGLAENGSSIPSSCPPLADPVSGSSSSSSSGSDSSDSSPLASLIALLEQLFGSDMDTKPCAGGAKC
ncbi:hypothetical protein C8R44DRAFT_860981 [Mycena epipterygia]|nr:hypothetical protein C8R44DRAFT_860981 [Mycena epipterygia]